MQKTFQYNAFVKTLDRSWKDRERQHATTRIMVEFKRVLHHEWSFGLFRWKLNAEKMKASEY